jgi:hypothetical protein
MQDINSYIVDAAGYVISSHTRAKCLADVLCNVADDLDVNAENALPEGFEEVFGSVANDPETRRAMLATRPERAAEAAIALAAELRAPKIDERESNKVGWDAKHSVG